MQQFNPQMFYDGQGEEEDEENNEQQFGFDGQTDHL